jgi:hypothetical protein
MIQGNQSPMDKAVFALILHTLQETGKGKDFVANEKDSNKEDFTNNEKNTFALTEI